MVKRILLLIICLNLLPHCIWAQNKLRFAALGEVGLIAGAAEPSGDARLSIGVKKQQLVLTTGAGIDAYRHTTAPLFIHARYYLLPKRVQPLVYISGGINLIADKDLKRTGLDSVGSWINWGQRNLRYEGGFYSDGGIGVALAQKNKPQHKLCATLGWSIKSMTEHYEVPGRNTGEFDPVSNRFTMRRLILRFGFDF